VHNEQDIIDKFVNVVYWKRESWDNLFWCYQ